MLLWVTMRALRAVGASLGLLRFGQLFHPVGLGALLGCCGLFRCGVLELRGSRCRRLLLLGADLGLIGSLGRFRVLFALGRLLVRLFLRGRGTLGGLLGGLALTLLLGLAGLLGLALFVALCSRTALPTKPSCTNCLATKLLRIN